MPQRILDDDDRRKAEHMQRKHKKSREALSQRKYAPKKHKQVTNRQRKRRMSSR